MESEPRSPNKFIREIKAYIEKRLYKKNVYHLLNAAIPGEQRLDYQQLDHNENIENRC